MEASSARNDAIDAFRGVAILSVLTFHYLVRWAPPFHQTNLYGFHIAYPVLFGVGQLGVHLFFVISGIVISMTVLRSRNAVEFAARRFARLYPAFLVALVLTFAIASLSPVAEFKTSLSDAVANLTMDAGDLGHRYVDGAYWSLAVEIKFYLAVAISYAILRHRFWIPLPALGAMDAALMATGHRIAVLLLAPYLPFFLAGMGLWFLAFEHRRGISVALFGVGFVLWLVCRSYYHSPFVPPWASDVYLAVTIGALAAIVTIKRRVAIPLLPALGRASYSLYLVHQVVGVILIAWLVRIGLPDLMAVTITGSLCIAVATGMYHFVEQPSQRWLLGRYRAIAESWRTRNAFAS